MTMSDEAAPEEPTQRKLHALLILYRAVLLDLVVESGESASPETVRRAEAVLTLDSNGEDALIIVQHVMRLAALVEPLAAALAPDIVPWPWPREQAVPEREVLREMLEEAADLLHGVDEEATDAWD
jgi:hypothetical protein